MAGIYIHIPFCKQACHYCNFHFSTSMRYKNDLISALLKELELRRNYLEPLPVNSVYFGGGTPSLLEINDLTRILNRIHSLFHLLPDTEITLEANPDDLNGQKLRDLKSSGINRLSIGVQSFRDEDLTRMHRVHRADQALDSIKNARIQGFENISTDLIYGIPGMDLADWTSNMKIAIDLDIPHLSCYALTVEPNTLLHKRIREKKEPDIEPSDQADQFLHMVDFLVASGYQHYEISNFSKPGKRSLHNSSYWQGQPYLGLGPSAHSYNGKQRSWNIASNSLYIDSIQSGELPRETEQIDQLKKLNETIMLSLRTQEGVDLELLETNFGSKTRTRLLEKSRVWFQNARLQHSEEKLFLTKEGKLLADGITADLFFEEDES